MHINYCASFRGPSREWLRTCDMSEAETDETTAGSFIDALLKGN